MNDELKNKEMQDAELIDAAGGVNNNPVYFTVGTTCTTYCQTGYLALRSAMGYDSRNEIGPLWNGSTVLITATPTNSAYVQVKVLSATRPQGSWGKDVTGLIGWVNGNYLTPIVL